MAYEKVVSIPAGTTANYVPKADGSGSYTWGELEGGTKITVSDTAPSNPRVGDFWFEVIT